MELPSRSRLFARGRAAVLRTARVSRAVIDRQFSDYNILLTAASAIAEEVVAGLARIQAILFLESVRGSDLDRYAFNRYGMYRKGASPALVYVRFTAPSGSRCDSFTIPAGTQCRSTTGVTFVTSEDVTFPSLDSTSTVFTTGDVPARSMLAGSSQQVTIESVTTVMSNITGAPTGFACVNDAASAGADDEETDSQFKGRVRKYPRGIGRGVAAAIENAAKAVPGVRSAVLVEGVDATGRPYPHNQLVITDKFAEGLLSVTAGYQTQADILCADVRKALASYRACGIPVDVVMAVYRPVSVSLSYTLASVYDSETAVRGRIKAAAVAYVNALARGQSLDVDLLRSAMSSVYGVSSVTVVTPSVSVSAGTMEALRTTTTLVSVVSGAITEAA